MQLSHNTNQVLQDSPQSTTQLLNQAHMMSHITCRLIHPLHWHFLYYLMSSSGQLQFVLSIAQPAVLFAPQSALFIIQLPCTRGTMYVTSSSQLICSHLVSDTTAHSLMQTSISLPLW